MPANNKVVCRHFFERGMVFIKNYTNGSLAKISVLMWALLAFQPAEEVS
jgi:hypothetical protein